MANYNFNSTAAMETIISKATAEYNQVNGQSFTNEQYIKFVLVDKIKGWKFRFADKEHDSLKDVYLAADDSTKAQIRTLLGV